MGISYHKTRKHWVIRRKLNGCTYYGANRQTEIEAQEEDQKLKHYLLSIGVEALSKDELRSELHALRQRLLLQSQLS